VKQYWAAFRWWNTVLAAVLALTMGILGLVWIVVILPVIGIPLLVAMFVFGVPKLMTWAHEDDGYN